MRLRAYSLLAPLLGVLLAGCALFPMPAPPRQALPGEVWCPDEAGPPGSLTCPEGVRAAVEALEPGDPIVVAASFVFGPCDCPINALCDCAIHQSGTVTLSFGDERRPVIVRVVKAGAQVAAEIEDDPTIR